LRILVFPERGGDAREWRFQQRHRAWLSIAGAGAAFLVAAFVYVLVAAYQDVVAVNHLRRELAIASHVQAENRTLRKQVAVAAEQNQKALTEVQAMTSDMHSVAGVLGLSPSSQGQGLDNLFTHLQTIQQQLPQVIAGTQAQDPFVARTPEKPSQGTSLSGTGQQTSGTPPRGGIVLTVPLGVTVNAPHAGGTSSNR
jgi:hypothetical protein